MSNNIGIAAARAFYFALAFAVVAFFLDAFADANSAVAAGSISVAAGAAAFEGMLIFALLFVAGLIAWDDAAQLGAMFGFSLGIVIITLDVHGWQGLATPADVPLYIIINFWWIAALLVVAVVLYHLATSRKSRGPTPPTGH